MPFFCFSGFGMPAGGTDFIFSVFADPQNSFNKNYVGTKFI